MPQGRQRDRGGQEEEAAAVGRRERQVPHEGQAQRGDGGRHEVAGEDRCSRRSRVSSAAASRCATSPRTRRSSCGAASGTSRARVDTGGPTETIPSLRVRSGSGLIAALLSVLAVLLVPAAASAVVPVTIQSDEQDGECAADCSLRDAVQIASHHRRRRPGSRRHPPLSLGELNVANVTIQGAGAGATVIQAGVNVRALQILGNATIGGVTITGGTLTTSTLAAASRSASARR